MRRIDLIRECARQIAQARIDFIREPRVRNEVERAMNRLAARMGFQSEITENQIGRRTDDITRERQDREKR